MKYVVFTENEETMAATVKVDGIVASPKKVEGIYSNDPEKVLKSLEEVKERGTYEIAYDGILTDDNLRRLRSLGYVVRSLSDSPMAMDTEEDSEEAQAEKERQQTELVASKETEIIKLKEEHEAAMAALRVEHEKEISALKDDLKRLING